MIHEGNTQDLLSTEKARGKCLEVEQTHELQT
jgi:hypothetical protein